MMLVHIFLLISLKIYQKRVLLGKFNLITGGVLCVRRGLLMLNLTTQDEAFHKF